MNSWHHLSCRCVSLNFKEHTQTLRRGDGRVYYPDPIACLPGRRKGQIWVALQRILKPNWYWDHNPKKSDQNMTWTQPSWSPLKQKYCYSLWGFSWIQRVQHNSQNVHNITWNNLAYIKWKISTCLGNESVMIELLELSERNLKEVIKIRKKTETPLKLERQKTSAKKYKALWNTKRTF